jgi:hypothetical protein
MCIPDAAAKAEKYMASDFFFRKLPLSKSGKYLTSPEKSNPA